MARQLELAEMIESLRGELARARSEGEGEGEAIRFQVEDVELELEIAAEEQAEGGMAAKFYVLTSQFKASKKDAVTQKLTLRLRPEEVSEGPDTGAERKRPLRIRGEGKARKPRKPRKR